MRPGPDVGIDGLEFELRRVPGVVGVGFSGAATDLSVHLVVPDPTMLSLVRAEAGDVVARHLDDPVSLVVMPAPAPAAAATPPGWDVARPHRTGADLRGEVSRVEDIAPSGSGPADGFSVSAPRGARVSLLAVRAAGGEVEVHLGQENLRTVGRATGARTVAAAEATVGALESLGWVIPFSVRTVLRLSLGVEGAVVVVLTGGDGERMGIGRGETGEQAAAKATLHALNRSLVVLPPR